MWSKAFGESASNVFIKWDIGPKTIFFSPSIPPQIRFFPPCRDTPKGTSHTAFSVLFLNLLHLIYKFPFILCLSSFLFYVSFFFSSLLSYFLPPNNIGQYFGGGGGVQYPWETFSQIFQSLSKDRPFANLPHAFSKTNYKKNLWLIFHNCFTKS